MWALQHRSATGADDREAAYKRRQTEDQGEDKRQKTKAIVSLHAIVVNVTS